MHAFLLAHNGYLRFTSGATPAELLTGSISTDRIPYIIHNIFILFFLTHFEKMASIIQLFNKKVLLRERKRHTYCSVASTPSVVLTGGGGTPSQIYGPNRGYPIPGPDRGGTPSQIQMGEYPSLTGGYPIPGLEGTPSMERAFPIPGGGGVPWGTTHLDLVRVPPHLDPGGGYLIPGRGVSPYPSGPGQGTPLHPRLDGGTPLSKAGWGYPPSGPDRGTPKVWTT